MTASRRWIGLLPGISLLLVAAARADVSALLRVSRAVPGATAEKPSDADEFRTLKATTAELARTRLVLQAALERRGIAELPILKEQPDPMAWVAERLEVRTSDSELIELTLRADGDEAAKLLDAVSRELSDQVNSLPREELAAWIAALKPIWKEAVTKASLRHRELEGLGREMGFAEGDSLQIRAELLGDRIAGLQRAIEEAKTRIRQLEAKLGELRERKDEEYTEADFDMYLRQQPEIGPKYTARDQTALELSANTPLVVDPQNEQYRRAVERAERAAQELLDAKQKLDLAAIAKEMRKAGILRADRGFEAQSLEASIASYQQTCAESEEELQRATEGLLQLTERPSDLKILAAQARREAAIADQLRQQIAEAESWLVRPPRVTILQPAAPALPRPESDTGRRGR